MQIKNGAALFVSSPFRFKTLFTKPLKYIIQIFTGEGVEHAARYIDNYVINMSGKGGELMHYAKWLKYYAVNGAKIHCIEPDPELTDQQVHKLKNFDKSFVGVKYDAIDAAISALDEIKQIRELERKAKGIFCSQQVFEGYVDLGFFPRQKDKVSPAELKRKLLKSPFFEDRWRRIR